MLRGFYAKPGNFAKHIKLRADSARTFFTDRPAPSLPLLYTPATQAMIEVDRTNLSQRRYTLTEVKSDGNDEMGRRDDIL